MIKTLEIKNFKSIKQLKLDCKRINIFIGEPNTGKSNILETVGIFSYGYYSAYGKPEDFVRLETAGDLFHDHNLHEDMEIGFDSIALKLLFKDGSFRGEWRQNEKVLSAGLSGSYTGGLYFIGPQVLESCPFKFYRFAIRREFKRQEPGFLFPPSGENLMTVLLTHKEVRSIPNRFLSRFGLRLGLRPHEGKIEVIKQIEDVIISYPYWLASDTLQRLVFHLAAVLSNKDSVIALEEPEAHAFPYHTKYLAETIALDDRGNQFFISTHNPYFLYPILEKAPKEDVAVYITYYEHYQTKTKLMSEAELEEITEIDVFANLDRFLEGR